MVLKRASLDRVTIITPTYSGDHLEECIDSVLKQNYKNIKHIIVTDGDCPAEKILRNHLKNKKVQHVALPWNTGGDGYLGGCIYPAVVSLISSGYIVFLDDDNFFDSNHIQSCIDLVEDQNLDWCYTLRKLVRRNSSFFCNDDCNSLGMWPSFDGFYHHIDTNCYFMRHDVATKAAWQLRRKAYIKGEIEGDRSLAKFLLSQDFKFFCTGIYSVNYRVKGHQNYSDKQVESYYLQGNDIMAKIYKIFPWSTLQPNGLMDEHPAIAIKHTNLYSN